jgi:hypothetical protein
MAKLTIVMTPRVEALGATSMLIEAQKEQPCPLTGTQLREQQFRIDSLGRL